jgi:hypothetical protein
LVELKMVFTCFGHLEDTNLSEIATDVITEVLRMIPPDDTLTFMPLITVILPPILETKVKVLEYLQKNDEDSVLPYARIYTEMGEALTEMLVKEVKNPQVAEIFQIELAFTKSQSIELSQMPFEFWQRLNDHFAPPKGRNNNYRGFSNGIHQEEPPVPAEFVPLFLELLNVLLERAQSPSDRDPFTAEEDDFAQYRGRLLQLVEEATRAIGQDRALEHVLGSLQAKQAAGVAMQEAHFVVLCRIVPYATVTETSVLWDLITSLPGLIRQEGNGNVLLEYCKKTAIDLVGALPKWLAQREESMRHALEMLSVLLLAPAPQLPATDPAVQRLQTLQNAAACAFNELANYCRDQLQPIASSLVQLYLQSVNLPGKSRLSVVEGLAFVLVDLEGEPFEQALSAVIGPMVQTLQTETGVETLADTLDFVQAIIRQVKCYAGTAKEAAMGRFITQLWPLLQQLLARFPGEPKIAEKCCRVVKHSMRCAPTPFKPLVMSLGQTLIQAFSACQHSSYLYSAEVLASTYGSDPELEAALRELHVQLSKIALGILQQNAGRLDEITEVVEDYYGMSERYIRHCPGIIFASDQLVPTLQLLPAVLRVIQRDAVEAVHAFTVSFYKYARRYEHVKAQAMQIGPQIVETVFRVILSVPPHYVTDQLAPVLNEVTFYTAAFDPQDVGGGRASPAVHTALGWKELVANMRSGHANRRRTNSGSSRAFPSCPSRSFRTRCGRSSSCR